MFRTKARVANGGQVALGAAYHDVAGLDTMRFLAAVCVVLSHQAMFPLAAYVPKKSGIWAILVGFNNTAFNGFAAVIIFFVISGFCIHYKYACGRQFVAAPFLSRRLLRIAIPAAGAVALANLAGVQARLRLDTVLWSLYYEMIYYLIYPALRSLSSLLDLSVIIGCSAVISAGLIALNWDNAQYWNFPLSYGWLVPFPAWLLGCLLAERTAYKGLAAGKANIWAWRLIGLSYAAFSLAYYYHGPVWIGIPALLFPFIFYCFFWIEKEISRFGGVGTSPILEWGGKWSYSIYLIHIIILVSLKSQFSLEPAFGWAVNLAAVLVGSYCFYLLVEGPSHRLARIVSLAISKRDV